jgi:hypothetical protein
MDVVTILLMALLTMSAVVFVGLAVAVGRGERRSVAREVGGLDGLMGLRHPLLPRTIRQTPLD